MLITIFHQPKELLVMTVTVSRNREDLENMLFFRCYRCGNGINQVQGYITSIQPGLIPHDDVPVIRKCEKCRELYTFQTQHSSKKDIHFTLPHPLNQMYCVNCRQLRSLGERFPQRYTCQQCQTPYMVDVA